MMKHISKYPTILRSSIIFYLVILTLTLILPTGCCRSSAGVIVAGSTSVQPFAEVLAEEYMILHPDITIDVQGAVQRAGIMAENQIPLILGCRHAH
jgi:phosphate transport system substrate-binding protein